MTGLVNNGGSGGTPGGSNTQVQYNNSSSFGGITGVTSDGTALIVASGDLKLSGSGSGTTILNAPATGGGTTVLPMGSGTLVYATSSVIQSINLNTTTAPTPQATTAFQITGADTTINVLEMDAFASANNVVFRRANTTNASPSNLTLGATIGAITAYGYGTTAYSSSQRAAVNLVTNEVWSDTAQGTRIVFLTTTNTTLATGENGRVDGTGFQGAIGATTPNTGAFTTLTASSTTTLSGATIVSGASFGLSGNISTTAWTTAGVRYKNIAATLTDTTSSGTVAAAYTDVFGGNTIAASSAVTYTKYATFKVTAPTAGTNVTFTNGFAIDVDSITVGTSGVFKVSTAGVLTTTGAQLTTPTLGVSVGTSLALGGATIGANALAVTGTILASSTITSSAGTSSFAQMNIVSGRLDMGGQGINTVGNITLQSGSQVNWNSDTFLTRSAAATIRFGAADAASPVAQIIVFQGPRNGTDTNIAGPNETIIGALATGSASSGDIIFQTGGAAGASGTTIATATEALRIKGVTGAITIASGKSLILGNAATTGLAAGVLAATTNATLIITDSTGQAYRIPCII